MQKNTSVISSAEKDNKTFSGINDSQLTVVGIETPVHSGKSV